MKGANVRQGTRIGSLQAALEILLRRPIVHQHQNAPRRHAIGKQGAGLSKDGGSLAGTCYSNDALMSGTSGDNLTLFIGQTGRVRVVAVCGVGWLHSQEG